MIPLEDIAKALICYKNIQQKTLTDPGASMIYKPYFCTVIEMNPFNDRE